MALASVTAAAAATAPWSPDTRPWPSTSERQLFATRLSCRRVAARDKHTPPCIPLHPCRFEPKVVPGLRRVFMNAYAGTQVEALMDDLYVQVYLFGARCRDGCKLLHVCECSDMAATRETLLACDDLSTTTKARKEGGGLLGGF